MPQAQRRIIGIGHVGVRRAMPRGVAPGVARSYQAVRAAVWVALAV